MARLLLLGDIMIEICAGVALAIVLWTILTVMFGPIISTVLIAFALLCEWGKAKLA